MALSAAAEREWLSLCERHPQNSAVAYDRLASSPLQPLGQRQFPMRGKLKGFWQYEISGGDRLHYFVRGSEVIVISAGPHPTSNAALQSTLLSRAKRT